MTAFGWHSPMIEEILPPIHGIHKKQCRCSGEHNTSRYIHILLYATFWLRFSVVYPYLWPMLLLSYILHFVMRHLWRRDSSCVGGILTEIIPYITRRKPKPRLVRSLCGLRQSRLPLLAGISDSEYIYVLPVLSQSQSEGIAVTGISAFISRPISDGTPQMCGLIFFWPVVHQPKFFNFKLLHIRW